MACNKTLYPSELIVFFYRRTLQDIFSHRCRAKKTPRFTVRWVTPLVIGVADIPSEIEAATTAEAVAITRRASEAAGTGAAAGLTRLQPAVVTTPEALGLTKIAIATRREAHLATMTAAIRAGMRVVQTMVQLRGVAEIVA